MKNEKHKRIKRNEPKDELFTQYRRKINMNKNFTDLFKKKKPLSDNQQHVNNSPQMAFYEKEEKRLYMKERQIYQLKRDILNGKDEFYFLDKIIDLNDIKKK